MVGSFANEQHWRGDILDGLFGVARHGWLGGLRMNLTLAWPDKLLSPNARVHWSVRAKAVSYARSLAYWTTREVVGPPRSGWTGAKIAITFSPPDRRRRDDDNAIGAFKAYRDGIADALGVDDSKFKCSYAFADPIKGGSVRVEILPI